MICEVRQDAGCIDYFISGRSDIVEIYDYYTGLRTWDSDAWYLGVF